MHQNRRGSGLATCETGPARLCGTAHGRAFTTPRYRVEAIPRQAGGSARCAFPRPPRRERRGHPGSGARPRLAAPRQPEGPREEAAAEQPVREIARSDGDGEAASLDPRSRPLPMATRIRRHLRIYFTPRVRSPGSARSRRSFDDRKHPPALPGAQRPRREARLRRRLDESVHAKARRASIRATSSSEGTRLIRGGVSRGGRKGRALFGCRSWCSAAHPPKDRHILSGGGGNRTRPIR